MLPFFTSQCMKYDENALSGNITQVTSQFKSKKIGPWQKAWIEQTDSLALGHNTCLETGKAWTYNDFVRSKVDNKGVTESFCSKLFLLISQRCHKTSYPMKPTEINLFKICHIKWSYFASIKQSPTNGISWTNSAS